MKFPVRTERPARFARFILPGFAFKAVVIGGGYATGREVAEFFLPCGPRGGLLAMAVATVIWAVVCALTFLFARATASLDYRSFFRELLGRAWPAFELAYIALLLLILSVFGAAAGAIGASLFGAPEIVGALCLMVAIALAVWHGNESVERVFKYVSILLYTVYAVFLILSLVSFGPEIRRGLTLEIPVTANWFVAGVSYAGYNVVCAIAVLPVVRHMTSQRDALVAGLLCGPLAIAPAMLFFICMCAFYPDIAGATLPSDWMLARLELPAFRVVFQVMIFAALVESGAGTLNAVNQRIATAYAARGLTLPAMVRSLVSVGIMVVAIFIATRFGLVALIAKGYPALTVLFLIVYIVPLLTYGLWRLLKSPAVAVACCAAGMLLSTAAKAEERFDVIIRHGEILDGSGRPGYVADVGVQDGYIVAIGDLTNETAAKDIDARGYFVTPGFINIHSHAEPNALPTAGNMLAQGVTTEILNPDGDGPVAIGAQLRELQRWGLAENVGAYIGFNSIWEKAVGLADHRPSKQEIRRMRALVTRGLLQGAWGVSAGLDYKPAYFARTDEVIAVVSAASSWRTNFPNHERIFPPAYSSRAGIAETIEIASAAGLAPEITHIKAQGHEQGRGPDIVALMTEATARGHYTPADVYPYLAGLTYLDSLLIPGWAQEGGPEAMLRRFADSILRERIARESEAAMNARLTGGPAGVLLPLVNKSLPDFMATEHVGAGEALLRILERAGGQEIPAILRFGADSDLEAFLGYRGTAVACDCGATLRKLIHPRYYGTFPRVLANYVRAKKLLTWEQAIQRMTGLPASTIGMVDRGFLQPGMAADLIVLDPNTISDHATFEAPWLAPEGVREVLVGGHVEWDNGAPTGDRGGRALFRSHHMPTRPPSSGSERSLTAAGSLAAAAPGGSKEAGRLLLDLRQAATDRHAVGTVRIEAPSTSDSLDFQSFGELQVYGRWASFTGIARWGTYSGPVTLIIDADDPLTAKGRAVLTVDAKGRRGSWTLPAKELRTSPERP